MSVRSFAVAVALLTITVALAAQPAQADEFRRHGILPWGSGAGASTLVDGAVYSFGGFDEATGRAIVEVVKYDPATRASTITQARLPEPLYWASAASDGRYAYVFGGRVPEGDGYAATDAILRYDPQTDMIETLPAKLSAPRITPMTATVDGKIYLFGGSDCSDSYLWRCDRIERFDPSTGALALLPARLPDVLTHGVAVVVGGQVYLLAGLHSSYSHDVYRFDLATERVTTLAARLDVGRFAGAGFTDGRYVYLMGGLVESSYTEPVTGSHDLDVVRFDPATGAFTTMYGRMAGPRYYGVAAYWTGSSALLLGGEGCGSAFDRCTDVVEYVLVPSAPADFDASSGLGAVTLTWSEPYENSHSTPVLGYRVYRAIGDDAWGARIPIADVQGLEFRDEGCPPLALCYYAVSAYNAFGESPMRGVAYDLPATRL